MAYNKADVCAALKRTKGLVFLAAEALGCAPQTIYNWADRSPDVRAVMAAERGKFIDIGELKLQQAVQNGEPWAVALVLKTLGKDRGYVERQEQTGKAGEPQTVIVRLPAKADMDEWTKNHGK